MGRKRKVVEPIVVIPNEVTASDANLDTTSDVEKLHLHTENSKATEATDVEIQNPGTTKPEVKRSGATSLVVRRSPRIRSISSPTEALKVVETINLVEAEKEQEPEVHHDGIPPEMNARTLEEKIDYIVVAADYFKSKVFRTEGEGPCSEMSYKSLYFDSQKKIEALMEENYELVRKLEFARGKIAAYEVMKEAMGAPKEFVLVSTLEKAANVTASLLTPQDNAPSGGADDPKPKKLYKKQVKY